MKKLFIILAAVFTLSLYGCSEDSENVPSVIQDELTLSSDTLQVSPEGGIAEVTITSSGDWRIIGGADWITPSVEGGKSGEKLTFQVQPVGENVRETVYKVFTGSTVKKLIVIQDVKYKLVLTSEEEMTVPFAGLTVAIELDSNIPDLSVSFSGENTDWVSVTDIADAFGKKIVSLTAKKNETYKSRSTEVIVSGKGLSVKVILSQEKQPGFIIETMEYEVNSLKAQDLEIPLQTNVEYELYDAPNWISIKEIKKGEMEENGLENQILVLHLDAAGGTREAQLWISVDGNPMYPLTIRQKNPNPVLAMIPDENFVRSLQNLGWITTNVTDGKYEVLEPGMNGTSISLTYGMIKSLEGIQSFPNLQDITANGNYLTTVDFSELENLTSVNLDNNDNLSMVKLGDNNITKFKYSGDNEAESLTISGTKVNEIEVSGGYQNYIKTLDLSACPGLTKIYTIGKSTIETIYVATGKAGTIEILKEDNTNVIEK